VSPGFDNSRAAGITKPSFVPRNNGATYDSSWSTLLNSHPEWIAIVSFNEWHETTQIEPAKPMSYNGFQYLDYEGAYGLHGGAATTAYINRTAYWADRFHRSSPPHASPPPATGQPSARPTPKPSAATAQTGTIDIPGLPPLPRWAVILVIIGGGLVAAGVLLRRRRR
jgi:hypothetical protein